MDKYVTREEVQDMIRQNLMSSSNTVVPRHTHNGVDTVQISSANLLPYPIENSVVTFNGIYPSQPNGSVQFFDFSTLNNDPPLYEWGIELALGRQTQENGISENINLADFWIDANLGMSTQIITAGSTDPILWNSTASSPLNYESSTGKFRALQSIEFNTQIGNFITGEIITGSTSGATANILSQNPQLIINNINGTFQVGETITGSLSGSTAVIFTLKDILYESWCIITASVSVTPSLAVMNESFDININVDGAIIAFNTFYFVDTITEIVGTIAFLMQAGSSEFSLSVTNNSANPITVGPGAPRNYFKVKQLVGHLI